MKSSKMSFEEIKADKDKFLNDYNLVEDFSKYEKLNGSWDEIIKIGSQYEDKQEEYQKKIQEIIEDVAQFESVHSYRYRLKKTDSLLKKVIIKSVKKNKLINSENYLIEITDLLGIRILYIFKEECFKVHQQVMKKFGKRPAESIRIKLRPGDDEKYYEKIINSDNAIYEKNSIYRSIHYTIYSNPNNTDDARVEIQTRTIFEEGWSEINHKLVYKNVADKYEVLKGASDILNGLAGDCDKMGSMMKTLYDEYINNITADKKNKDGKPYDKASAKTVGEVFQLFLNS